jgi:hypothetical protein
MKTAGHFYSAPGTERRIWSPDAHELFGEHCYYYLLSSQDARGSRLIDSVRRIASEMGIGAPTCHIVFGPLDALVRIWLPDDFRESFLRNLQSPAEPFELESILEFKARTIEYTWQERHSKFTADDVASSELELIKRDIQLVSEDDSALTFATFDALSRLQHRGLLTNFTATPGVKVYMFLYAATQLASTSLPCDAMRLARLANSGGLADVSVYEGEGFCDYIVKGVCESFIDVNGFVQSFQDEIVKFGLHGWTLTPADYGHALEGEEINLPREATAKLAGRLSRGDQRYERAIRATLADARIYNRVIPILSAVESRLEPREILRFDSVLGALLSRNRRAINQRLSFLISIESGLRDLIPLLAAQHFPLDYSWIANQPEVLLLRSKRGSVAEDVNSAEELGAWLKTVDLPILFGCLHSMYSGSQSVQELINELMPSEDWMGRSEDMVALRDEYAHGLLLETALDNAFDDAFWIAVESIASAIPVQIGIENVLAAASAVGSD